MHFEFSFVFQVEHFKDDLEQEVEMEITENSPQQKVESSQQNKNVTPEKIADDSRLFLTPPPTGHSQSRRRASQQLSCERRKQCEKIKKKINFDKPTSFSLPKLHEHIFGCKPKVSHGSEVDVMAMARVCASKATEFLNFTQTNSTKFSESKKMW
jgi:hypothetical protein